VVFQLGGLLHMIKWGRLELVGEIKGYSRNEGRAGINWNL
jgi:hypothetical protein